MHKSGSMRHMYTRTCTPGTTVFALGTCTRSYPSSTIKRDRDILISPAHRMQYLGTMPCFQTNKSIGPNKLVSAYMYMRREEKSAIKSSNQSIQSTNHVHVVAEKRSQTPTPQMANKHSAGAIPPPPEQADMLLTALDADVDIDNLG